MLFNTYHMLIINRYAEKIIDAVRYNDIEEGNRLLNHVYKRQKGIVYKKLCKKIDNIDYRVLELLDVEVDEE